MQTYSKRARLLLLLALSSLAFVACGDGNENERTAAEEVFVLPEETATAEGDTTADGDDTENDIEAPGANDGAPTSGGETTEPTREIDGPTDELELGQGESGLLFMPLAEAGDVVSFVDVPRYMGTWYEIATTPSFQQRSCYNTEANYTFNEASNWVDVVNGCNAGSPTGRPQRIQGRAELVDEETQAKLAVIFFGQRAPYWVVALDGTEGTAPYQWAVVSVPGGRTMWILSRTPEMSAEHRNAINAHLLERGFPIDRLIDTPQQR